MNIIIVLLTHARWYKSTDRCGTRPLFSTRGVATPDYSTTGLKVVWRIRPFTFFKGKGSATPD